MIIRVFIVWTSLYLICPSFTKGQDSYTIKVVSSLTDKPINEASILIQDSIFTKTNYLGYFQIKANQNDTLVINHPDYEPQYIVLPITTKFQVLLNLKKELLEYSLGLSGFYKELQKRIRYPKKALNKRLQVRLLIELKIDSLGRATVHSDNNPAHEIFLKEIERSFKDLPGNWSKEYAGKVLILPVLFKIQSMPPQEIGTNVFPNNKVVLSEVVVTGY